MVFAGRRGTKRRDLADLPACQTDEHGYGLLALQRPGERVKLSS
jgi:hypothetical protein